MKNYQVKLNHNNCENTQGIMLQTESTFSAYPTCPPSSALNQHVFNDKCSMW